MVSVFTFPLSFLILFIWVLSFPWWVWIKVCQFFYLFKEPALGFIDSFVFSFLDSLSFISAWSLLFPLFYSLLALFNVLFLVPLRAKLDRLRFSCSWGRPQWLLFIINYYYHYAMNSPHRAAFAGSHSFQVVWLSFSFFFVFVNIIFIVYTVTDVPNFTCFNNIFLKNPHLRICLLILEGATEIERDRERETMMWEGNFDRLYPVCPQTKHQTWTLMCPAGDRTCNILSYGKLLQPTEPPGQDCFKVSFDFFLDLIVNPLIV